VDDVCEGDGEVVEIMTTSTELYIKQVLDVLPRSTPTREQIATELRSHVAERIAAGQSEADVLKQLGDPMTLAESYLAAVPLVPVSFWRRAGAKFIDVGLLAVFVVPLACLAWFYEAPFLAAAAIVGGSFLFAFYVIVAEAEVGQTVGKRLLDLRVVRESGARISIGQSMVRQLPMFLQVFWIDVMFALFTEKHQRAFELLSKTRVVAAAR
jgi:uncharacterized RDD family membrane protein YckC